MSRLASLSQDLSGTGADLALGFQYNKAGQITELTRSRDLYAFTAPTYGGTLYETGGLNQLTKVGAALPTHDGRGNLTFDGAKSYSYSTENLLVAGPNGATLSYDPAMRLYQTNATGVSSRKFAYDGADLIAEYDGNNVLTRRHVHGPGVDEPLVTYEGSDTATRRWLHADERGSIVASSNVNGAAISTNKYDEYGVPGSGNDGRFQYTGQTWLAELGLYYYKARMYDPKLGRFLQTDPIGYGDGLNLYAYVGADPVNFKDPTGLTTTDTCKADQAYGVATNGVGVVCGPRLINPGGAWASIEVGTGGGAGPGSNPLDRPHGERRPTQRDNCQAAVDAIGLATAARLGTGFNNDTLEVLNALAFGGPARFEITDAGMAVLQADINSRPEGLVFVGGAGNGIEHHTFNFAPGLDQQYTMGYSSPSHAGALLGRAHVYMSAGKLIGVSDRFDYVGEYNDVDVGLGVAAANAMLNASCPGRQASIPIKGGIVPQ